MQIGMAHTLKRPFHNPKVRAYMDDNIQRQLFLLCQLLDDYLSKKISLNTLINKIEAITALIDNKEWTELMYPFLLELEQINASKINNKEDLSLKDQLYINILVTKRLAEIDNFKRFRL